MGKEQFNIRKSTIEDCSQIFELYQSVSKTEGGLARTQSEITKEYIEGFTVKALERGIQYVAIDQSQEGRIVGEIHCYKLEPKVFDHILSELTIAIDPEYQSRGLGKKLFQSLLSYISEERKDILRLELIARESNQKAIRLYEKLGFVAEGRFERRIRSTDLSFEADIPMAWLNEKFTS